MKKRMFRSLIYLTLAVCLLTALLCGCRGVESCPAAPEQTADTSLFLTEPGSWDGDVPQDIIELIETAGHRVTRTATAPGILHGQRYHMELDDDKLHAVSVYKYENAEDAAAEAACIGTDSQKDFGTRTAAQMAPSRIRFSRKYGLTPSSCAFSR